MMAGPGALGMAEVSKQVIRVCSLPGMVRAQVALAPGKGRVPFKMQPQTLQS